MLARGAYGDIVERAVNTAAVRLLENKVFLRRCISALGVGDQKTLRAGLERLAKIDWTGTARKRRTPKT